MGGPGAAVCLGVWLHRVGCLGWLGSMETCNSIPRWLQVDAQSRCLPRDTLSGKGRCASMARG